MKVFFQFFIIIFVILSLFVVKDDVKTVYNRVYSYIQKNSDIPQGHFFNFESSKNDIKLDTKNYDTDNTDEVKSSNVKELPKYSETPGPLRVISDLIANNKDQVDLLKSDVITLTNKNRKDNGNLPPLKENQSLDQSAEKKLKDMFSKQYFEHISPSGLGVSDLGNQVGYDYILIGENLALGNFRDSKALLDAWMASSGHRANILNNHYTEIGVAVGKGVFDGQEVWMAVQHFGLPRNACPVVDEVLRGVITLNQKNIKDMESDLVDRLSKINSGVVYNGYTHNELISQYNELVSTYNKLITDTKSKIEVYNAQVRELNNCISSSTAGL